ncbi:DUF4145 domain-containing protein [Microbacterium sp. S1037]|uniref:DUF4145 domain-containing protein n=1 Tax=Microbacterium sp. S1037 TaxID=3398227 RepID=UPI003AAD5545
MPADARAIFVEAALVAPASKRAAAALARASLEILLKQLFPDSQARNMQERIGEIRQHVRPTLWKLLTTLRVVGNDALHSSTDGNVVIDLTGDEDDILDPLLGAINLLVEELITQPSAADEIYNMVPENKRRQAEMSAARFTQPD